MEGAILAIDVSDFTLFFVIILILLAALAVGSVFYFKLSKKRDTKHYNEDYHSAYYFEINLRTQKVLKYNIRELGRSDEETYVDFLARFSSEDQNKVKVWLKNKLDNGDLFDKYDYDNVDLFTITDLRTNSILRRVAIKIVDIKKDQDVVFLETFQLSNFPIPEFKNKRRSKKTIYELGEVKKNYEDGFFAKGSSYLICFFKKEDVESIYNESLLCYLILNDLYKLFDKNTLQYYFKNPDTFEIGILDSNFITIADTRVRLEDISNSIMATMEAFGFNRTYDYTIIGGIVSDLSHSFGSMYNSLYQYIDENYEKNVKYGLFRKEENFKNASDNLRRELNNVIAARQIEALYRPIVQIKGDRIINYGYYSDFKIKNKNFKNLDALKRAGKQFNQCKGVISLCMKEVIPQYFNARENYFSKLIIPIDYDELEDSLDQAARVSHLKESHIVFLIDINEFLDIDEMDEVIEKIKDAQIKGYEIGILMRQGEFNVKRELFEQIDVLFVDCELEENVKADSKSFISAHAFLEKIVSYKKPIIEINARSFNEIELIYRSGIQYFTSDCIQELSSMITPLDKKTIKKLINMNK